MDANSHGILGREGHRVGIEACDRLSVLLDVTRQRIGPRGRLVNNCLTGDDCQGVAILIGAEGKRNARIRRNVAQLGLSGCE